MFSRTGNSSNDENKDSGLPKNTHFCNALNSSHKNEDSTEFVDDKILRMMQKMGYKSGSGLGKNEQGLKKVVEVAIQLGKRGFGLKIKDLNFTNESWDFYEEDIQVREKLLWLENTTDGLNFPVKTMKTWIRQGAPKLLIEEESNFCDVNVIADVIKGKGIFDVLNEDELRKSRAKANPFETIRMVFFKNRAALKMANIDAATDFMFTNIDNSTHHKQHKGPYYFADVCAGPGGFTEYILWRKKWHFKGFGLTLKGENDFNLTDSVCSSPETFQALYGAQGDGNVCCPDNIKDFKEQVLHQTGGNGVHFMMADGGFSVEGYENIQEILSKNIYICQCLLALEIVRNHGHFVTKLFDIFTPFSVGIIYLMYNCFEKVAILKPNSSRPANSERYFICSNLRSNTTVQKVKSHMRKVVKRLWELQGNTEIDVLEIVSLEVLKGDTTFCNYIAESINNFGKRQVIALKKLGVFCRNPALFDARQTELRKQCLEYWQIPDKVKCPLPPISVDDLLMLAGAKPELLLVQPREINDLGNLKNTVQDIEDWHYYPTYCPREYNNCCFYAGLGYSRVYRLQGNNWIKAKNIQLVRGTLLYGELVKERCTCNSTGFETTRYSLHVIDALRLGETSLASMRFQERLNLVNIYCEAVNRESYMNSIRIRPKIISKLGSIISQPVIMKNKITGSFYTQLPVLGFQANSEILDVNSVMLLKTNDNQSFHSTYVLRAHIFIDTSKNEYGDENFSLEMLTNYVKEKIL